MCLFIVKLCKEREVIIMKTYVCKRIRLFTFLSTKGFYPYKVDKDRRNKKYLVWLYIDTPELSNAVSEYYLNLQTSKER